MASQEQAHYRVAARQRKLNDMNTTPATSRTVHYFVIAAMSFAALAIIAMGFAGSFLG